MIEHYNPQEIIDVSTPEVARWSARLDRMNMALENNNRVVLGGMSDDGVIMWELAEKALKGESWQNDPMYEDAILYELKPGISYGSVIGRATEEREPVEVRAETQISEMAYQIGRIAARTGLQRLGLWQYEEEKRPSIPTAAIAALCFRRADIEDDIDRKLYDRKDEIREATVNITRTARPRGLVPPASDSGAGQKVVALPVYRVATWLPREKYAALGFDPCSPMDAWWQELLLDLERIDKASDVFNDSL